MNVVTRLGRLALPAVVAACAYYNAMWSADQLADQARRLERQGRLAEARTHWARAAEKAETVLARHPRSRWAYDALVLRGEGLGRSGACAAAAGPLARALATAADEALRERAALAAAECALSVGGDAVAAAGLLAPVADSENGERRARAALLAGRAAVARGDTAGALSWYARSASPGAGPARARLLIAAGRLAEARALLDTLARRRLVEGDWASVLDDLGRAGGPEAAAAALDRLLAARRLPSGVRARLLLADGDRRRAHGDLAGADARYASVMRLVPDSAEARAARVRRLGGRVAVAERLEDLLPLQQELAAFERPGGAGSPEARALAGVIDRLLAGAASEAALFRAAELARDSLGAPRLAAGLFLELAGRHPASLFAPKALVAALPLAPALADSVRRVLDTRYGASAYARALRGESSPAFTAAEDSLAQALGLGLARPVAVSAGRAAPPLTGPRGPWLDLPEAARPAAPRRPERL